MSIAAEDLVGRLTLLEEERCRCIVQKRFERLEELLSPRLIHTHTRGNVDDRASYLHFISTAIESIALKREGLRIVLLSDRAAVMHGKQINVARRRGHDEELTVESMVLQTWACEEEDVWRLVAFQATALGALPPVVAR